MRRPSLLAALACAAACAEPPSFTVRWRVGEPLADGATEPADAPPLAAPYDCARVGLFQVLVQTWTEDGAVLLDERPHRCFPASFEDPDGAVDGPNLPPGTYQVRLQGVRRDGFAYDPPETGRFAPGVTILDGVTIEDAQATIRLGDGDDPIVAAPAPCNDGIDNDGDGFVDGSDLACRVGAGTSEDDPTRILQVRLEPTFFGDNPNLTGAASCLALDVDRFEVRDDEGTLLGAPACADAAGGVAFVTWISARPPATVSVTAVAADGTPRTTAKTVPVVAEGLTVADVDFADTDFLEPVVAPFGFALRFEGGSSDCADPDPGLLTLAQVTIEVRGAHGEPLDPPVRLNDGTPLDPAAPLACPSAALVTEPLSWGGFLVEAKALSPEGEVCFATAAPEPAAPGTPIAFVVDLARVVPPPPSCRTCQEDDDCLPAHTCSADGLCEPAP